MLCAETNKTHTLKEVSCLYLILNKSAFVFTQLAYTSTISKSATQLVLLAFRRIHCLYKSLRSNQSSQLQ